MASVSIQPAPPCTTMAGLGHDHGFGQGTRQRAETRTLVVAAITCLVMLVEVAAGLWTGSMALLADGIHMGGHAVALGLASAAYYLTRRHARDRRLSLGSGKINDLAAYTSALLLGLSTLWLVLESARRLFYAEPLQALEAMAVAAVGLVVNLLSVWLLAGWAGTTRIMLQGIPMRTTTAMPMAMEITTCARRCCTCWPTPPPRSPPSSVCSGPGCGVGAGWTRRSPW
ncbi:cation diffusion facilitator family transporter [Verminephrobacter aporrectodeae]|uniref:cation diffusion facilitator family transporter n=1 Tax=Verminephrobacter aporrectodeae TaxID=1110389 RepID=UPI0022420EE7|nr:cation diffusion facilitator family transporter [Verminephrobacter aporrectodeae]